MKQEIELKYQLASKADFRHFMAVLKEQAAGQMTMLKQKNIFFDTPALDLQSKGLSLRLRRQNRRYFLCAKQSTQSLAKASLSCRLEYEAELNAHLAKLIEQQLLSPLDVFVALPAPTKDDLITRNQLSKNLVKAASTGLQIIGFFTNSRTMIPLKLDGHLLYLELDHAVYPDRTQIFEVEVEFNSEREARLLEPAVEAIFKEIGIETCPSMAKSARLYAILFQDK